jgi:hypothetical protein
MLVIVSNPAFKGLAQRKRPGPFLEPPALFLQSPSDSFRVRTTLGVVLAGKALLGPHEPTGLHKGCRGGLTANIAHQREAFPPGAIRELTVDCQIQSLQPRPGRAGHARVVAHALLGVPGQHQDDSDPAEALDHHFGHVDAPPLVGLGRFGWVPGRRPLRLQRPGGPHQQLRRSQQPQPVLLIDGLWLNKAQRGPDPTVAPERRLGLECLNAREQAFVPLGHPERARPCQPSSASLVCNARSKSPTRPLSVAFSRSRGTAFRAC